MKIKITNKDDIVESIVDYFKNEEAGEYEEVHFNFFHELDRDRVLKREVPENEVIEVFGYLEEECGEVSMQETDDIFTYYNLEIFENSDTNSIVEKLKELEQEDIPYDIESYIQYFELKKQEYEQK